MSPALRSLTAADLAAVHELQRHIETHDGLPIATPVEEFLEWVDDPHLDLAADTRAVEADGRMVGWGRIWHRPSGVREERAYLLGGIDPAHRGRGLGSTLLAWQCERAEAILRAASPRLPGYVRATAFDFQHAHLRLFARHGMTVVRATDELLRDLVDLPEVRAGEGIAIVPWDPARSEAARMATNESFADHWGSTPRDPAAWAHEVASFGTRLDWSFLALDGDRVVGACRNAHFPGDEAVTGRRDGWIGQVGVIRSHRQRGIASALIAASLRAFRDAGMMHSALGVDRDNPTGAYSLYERLGYRLAHRRLTVQRECSS